MYTLPQTPGSLRCLNFSHTKQFKLDRGSIRSSLRDSLSKYSCRVVKQCWTVTPRPFPHWRLAFGPSWTEFVYLGCCSILIMVQQVRKLTLGLTLSTPGLVLFIFYTLRQLCTSHINLLLSVKLADILSLSLYWVLFW